METAIKRPPTTINMERFRNSYWRMIVVAVLACSGCVTDDNGKDVVVQVDEEFRINLNELLGTNRQLFFELESVEDEQCLNSSIDLSVIPQPDKITLNLIGIKAAVDCNPGIAPASSNINAGGINNGVYDFLIVIGNTVENEGKLTVSNTKYELNMYTTDGIIITNKVLFRIPNLTIWGYVAYDDELLVGAAPANFITDIENIAQPHQLIPGYYGNFDLQPNGEMTLKSPPLKSHHQNFMYHFGGTDEELKAILQNYRASFSNDIMKMVIYTSTGKTL